MNNRIIVDVKTRRNCIQVLFAVSLLRGVLVSGGAGHETSDRWLVWFVV